MISLLRRLRARLRHRHFNANLQEELESHRAMVEEELHASGLTTETARRQAAAQIGNVTLARESARGVWISPWLESVWQDTQYAARSLWRSRGFTATALLTLTLGIGVNTVLFLLLNALLLHPWRSAEAHALVLAYHRMEEPSGEGLIGVSAPELNFLRQHAATVDVAGTRQVGGALWSGDNNRSVRGRLVSSNYFDVLKVPVTIGRGLQSDDDRPDQPAAIVLGHDLWTGFFSSDPNIVGRRVRFRNVPATVVGVAGPGVGEAPFGGAPEMWMPLRTIPLLFPDEVFAREFMSNPGHCCVDLIGRLRPGHNRTRAEAELSALDRQFRRDNERRGAGMRVTGTEPIHDPEMAKALPVFALLLAGASLVLLVSCANVGNLQLARAAARRREIAVRMALGAARRRVVRQLVTEGLVLSALAVFSCLFVSSFAVQLLTARLDPTLARTLDFSIDGRVWLFAAGMTVVTALATSLAPALRGTRHLVGGRTADRVSLRLRSTFLGAQVAVSVVLLVAAALLSRSLVAAASKDVGFRLDTLMAMHVERPSETGDRAFLRDVMTALNGRPIAAAAAVPLGDESFHTDVRRSDEAADMKRQTRFLPVSSNYFAVLGIPLRAGRTFGDRAEDEVVLNETLARMLWPEGNAVGGRLAGPGGTIGRQVVGVVADSYVSGLGRIEPTIFQPASTLAYLLFDRDRAVPDELSAIVAGVDRSATVTVRSVADNVRESLETTTMGARAASSLGLLALLVTAVGIGGVFSFVVTERTREIGIRLALGASRQRVRALLLRRTGLPIAVGLTFGLAMAGLAGQALRSYLYGLSPSDPPTYAAVIVIVVSTAALATFLPIRRAIRVNPAATLRHD
jgi:predicted permease